MTLKHRQVSHCSNKLELWQRCARASSQTCHSVTVKLVGVGKVSRNIPPRNSRHICPDLNDLKWEGHKYDGLLLQCRYQAAATSHCCLAWSRCTLSPPSKVLSFPDKAWVRYCSSSTIVSVISSCNFIVISSCMYVRMYVNSAGITACHWQTCEYSYHVSWWRELGPPCFVVVCMQCGVLASLLCSNFGLHYYQPFLLSVRRNWWMPRNMFSGPQHS